MKRATLAAVLLGLLTFSCEPAFAAAPGDTAGPITNQAARDGAACPRCDLSQADLSYQDLDECDFTGAHLR